MAGDVALAMLHRDERWLLQLRDDVEGILHPGHWGLFGGHLERNESPEAAIQRELQRKSAGPRPQQCRRGFNTATATEPCICSWDRLGGSGCIDVERGTGFEAGITRADAEWSYLE